jgi:hypothetical protein
MSKVTREMRAAGRRCVDCGKALKTRAHRCVVCASLHTFKIKGYRERRRGAGLCPRCGKRPLPDGFRRCFHCIFDGDADLISMAMHPPEPPPYLRKYTGQVEQFKDEDLLYPRVVKKLVKKKERKT